MKDRWKELNGKVGISEGSDVVGLNEGEVEGAELVGISERSEVVGLNEGEVEGAEREG